jgi:hypothetical protein
MTEVRNLGETVGDGFYRIENRHQSLESDVRVLYKEESASM